MLEASNAPSRDGVLPRRMGPVLMTGVSDDMLVMKEEIFGPLLPVVAYESLDEAQAYVAQRPRPLALYYFDRNAKRRTAFLQNTASGGATLNDTIFHVAQESLPFGGIGPSGIGAYHGREGFLTFSHARGVFDRSVWTPTGLLTPPYGKTFARLMHWMQRWLNRR